MKITIFNYKIVVGWRKVGLCIWNSVVNLNGVLKSEELLCFLFMCVCSTLQFVCVCFFFFFLFFFWFIIIIIIIIIIISSPPPPPPIPRRKSINLTIQDKDELFEVIGQALLAAFNRNALSGWGARVFIVYVGVLRILGVTVEVYQCFPFNDARIFIASRYINKCILTSK